MIHRVAAVSFLNTLPLIDRFLAGGDPRVALSRALPSRLSAELSSGRADVALLPVAEILRGRSGGLLEPGMGIACRGAADSVKLFHRGPAAAVRRVRADRGSRSSVALLRILLAERWGTSPEFVETEPEPGSEPAPAEGLLVIGDRCFACERALAGTDVEALDLGAAWFELTGLPFVFAAWALSPAAAAGRGPDQRRELGDLLSAALDDGLARRAEIAAREAAAGQLGPGGEATVESILYYFEHSLHYRLDADDLAGIEAFRQLGIRHGILPPDAAAVSSKRSTP